MLVAWTNELKGVEVEDEDDEEEDREESDGREEELADGADCNVRTENFLSNSSISCARLARARCSSSVALQQQMNKTIGQVLD